MRVYTRYPKKRFLSNLSLTSWIIIINIIFFIITYILGFLDDNLINYLVLNPSLFLENFYFWTLLTSMFMHGNLMHLFVNMFSLFFIGGFIEKIIGRKRFFWFYIISGIFAGLLFVFASALFGNNNLLGTSYNIAAVGASGALFGVAGLMMILTPNLPLYVMFIPLPIKAKYAIPGLLIVIALLAAFGGFPVGNMAHFGGLIAGIIYGVYLRKKYKRKTRAISYCFK